MKQEDLRNIIESLVNENKLLKADRMKACNDVILGYTCNQKTDHDSIHVINEMIRNKKE